MKAALVSIVLVGSALVGSPAGFAQAAGDLSIQVGECVELTSAAERYACFERQVDAALTEEAETANHAGARGTQGAAIDTQVRDSDSPSDAEPSTRAASAAEEDGQPGDIVSTIAALDERLPDQYVITLENGQTWHQMTSKRYALRVGQRVRVYSTHWGNSYRLAAEELKGFIQVERLR
jgi:hypothetical protein